MGGSIMPKIEAILSQEEKDFIREWIKIKDYKEAGLVRYALKRYLSTNKITGLEMPDSLRLEKIS
jgi:hypothetical protein